MGESPSCKSGGYWHCGIGDMFLVVERQDSTCPNLDKPLLLPLKYMACHARTYETSGRRHNNLPVCPMKDSQS